MTHVEVRRNGPLFAVVGAVAVLLAIGYVVRGITDGGVFTWLAALVMAGLGVAMLVSWLESRTPLMVADDFGIRIRLGREWRGLPWSSLEQVVVEPRTSLVHDGRLVVVPAGETALEDLDGRARRQVAVTERLYGAELVVPLGMTTRVSVPHLVDALGELAGTRAAVVELASWAREPVVPMDPEHLERREARAREAVAAGTGARMGGHLVESRFERQARAFEGLSIFEDLATSVSSGVSRGVTGVATLVSVMEHRRERTQVRLAELDVLPVDGATALQPELLPDETDTPDLPEAGALRRGEQDWSGWDDSGWDARPEAPADEAETRAVADDDEVEHAVAAEPEAPDAEIGARFAEARERLGLSIATLAERTRIQPAVIGGIEEDDFGPCGGDFYARGHLRTLATSLGLSGDAAVASYDAHHASAPVNATRVFEADLRTGKDEERTGRRWAMILGIVLTLVLAWGLARLFAEPEQPVSTPSITGTSARTGQHQPITSAFGGTVPMIVTAARGPAVVTIKDRSGRVLFTGDVASGGSRQVVGLAPFTITADLPANVDVTLDGKAKGTVGTGYTEATRSVG